MVKNTRIVLEDNMVTAIMKLAEGNPGALTALSECVTAVTEVDPDSLFGGVDIILSLDLHGIYGSDIYVLWSDICGRDSTKMIAVLRAVQLGLFNDSVLVQACSRQDRSGKDIVPVDELYYKVCKELPNFDKKNRQFFNKGEI